MPSPATIIGSDVVRAKAPITPSSENAESKTFKYTNNIAPPRPAPLASAPSPSAMPSVRVKRIMPMMPARKIVSTEPCAKKVMRNKKRSASAISIASTLPHFTSRDSMTSNQCTFLLWLKKDLRATIAKKIPPNALKAVSAEVKRREYSSGFPSASAVMVNGETSATMLTITMGNANRVPKTDSRIPHVKKRLCHLSDISSKTLAFTTALSKERVISSTTNTEAKSSAPVPPQKYTAQSAARATTIGPTKSLITLL